MVLKDYCPQCTKFITVIYGTFTHPDLGAKSAKFCSKCRAMTYMKDDGKPETIA